MVTANPAHKSPPIQLVLPGNSREILAIALNGMKAGVARWTLFLTPIEQAAWEDLALRVGKVGEEDRVALPAHNLDLDSSWGPISKPFDRDEFLTALGRFVGYGILEYVGDGKPEIGKGVFRFRVCPESISIMQVHKRYLVKVAREYMEIMRAVQSGTFRPTQWTRGWAIEFRKWASERTPNLNASTVVRKMCHDDLNSDAADAAERGARADGSGGWGILKVAHDESRICWPGFEPFEFTPTEEGPRRRADTRGRNCAKQVPASTEQPSVPATSPTPGANFPKIKPAEDLDTLAAEEAKLHEQIEAVRAKRAKLIAGKRADLENALTTVRTETAKLREQLSALESKENALNTELATLSE